MTKVQNKSEKPNHRSLQTEITDQAAVYVGTYKKYNEGSIYGAWIDLTEISDIDEFYNLCRELHTDEDDAELMFQDWQSVPEGFISESHINENLFEYLEMYNELSETQREAFDDFIKNDPYSYKDDPCSAFDDFEEKYQGEYKDMEDFAYEIVEQCGMLDGVSEDVKRYFDYESYGRDLELGGDYWISDNGHVFSSH